MPMATAQVTFKVKRNLAGVHLLSAASAAKKAHQTEQNNDTSKLGRWFDEMMQNVPVSIVMAGAALEVGANELILTILDRSTPLMPGLGASLQLREIKDDRSGNSLDRYRKIAWLFDKDPNKGSTPWQNADTLVHARNNLMHFKPVWEDAGVAIQESKLVAGLKSKVGILQAYTSPALCFPHSFMTYDCAKMVR
jgi:hypothetical protein